MSSNEEYLDSLLKSLTQGGGNTDESSADVHSGEGAVSGGHASKQRSGRTGTGEYNKAMSVDEIAAMFASMGEDAIAEEQPVSEDSLPDAFRVTCPWKRRDCRIACLWKRKGYQMAYLMVC